MTVFLYLILYIGAFVIAYTLIAISGFVDEFKDWIKDENKRDN